MRPETPAEGGTQGRGEPGALGRATLPPLAKGVAPAERSRPGRGAPRSPAPGSAPAARRAGSGCRGPAWGCAARSSCRGRRGVSLLGGRCCLPLPWLVGAPAVGPGRAGPLPPVLGGAGRCGAPCEWLEATASPLLPASATTALALRLRLRLLPVLAGPRLRLFLRWGRRRSLSRHRRARPPICPPGACHGPREPGAASHPRERPGGRWRAREGSVRHGAGPGSGIPWGSAGGSLFKRAPLAQLRTGPTRSRAFAVADEAVSKGGLGTEPRTQTPLRCG